VREREREREGGKGRGTVDLLERSLHFSYGGAPIEKIRTFLYVREAPEDREIFPIQYHLI